MTPGSGLANVTERIATIQSMFGAPPARTGGADSAARFGDVLDQVGSDPSWAGLVGRSDSSGGVGDLVGRLSLPLGSRSGLSSGGQADGEDIVRLSLRHLGTPYVWGAESPEDGFDCSGLVQYVYRQAGIELPRVSRDQALAGTPVPDLASALPGDLVAFNDPVDHIGIYAGEGRMIVAPRTGDVVKVQEIRSTPTAIRRILGSVPPTLPAVGLTPTPTPALSPALSPVTPPALAALASGQGVWAFIPTAAPVAPAGTPLLPGSMAPATMPAVAGSAASAMSGVDAEVASSPFGALFVQAGARHGVPPSLLEAVAQAESGFDPTAVSPVGAQGLMQIMPGTARELGVDPMDPAQAVDGAARLLRRHIDRFGSLELALAAYNAGPGAVDRFDGIPPYRETQDYVRKILADLRVAAPSGAGNADGGAGRWSGPGVMGTSGVPTLMAAAAPGALNGADPTGVGPLIRRLRWDGPAVTPAAPTAVTAPGAPVVQALANPAPSATSTAATNAAATPPLLPKPGSTPTPATPPSTGAPSLPPVGAPAAGADVAPDGSALVPAAPGGPKPGDWGPNTQMQVRTSGGYNVRSWRDLGFLEAAAPGDLQALGVNVTTPIAKGVARILRDATPAQLASREFRETVNTINREILQLPDAPDVLPLTPPAAPAGPAPATPSTATAAAPATATPSTATPSTPATALPTAAKTGTGGA